MLEQSNFRWRPMVSYVRHHYRGLLSFLGKFGVYAMRELKLGCSCLDPSDFVAGLHYFNAARVAAEKNACRVMKVDWDLYDITDFFPRACRKKAKRAVKRVVKLLKKKLPGRDCFCVSREPGKKKLDPGSAKGRWRKRSSRVVKPRYLSKKVTRREYGMSLDLMSDAVSLDFEFGVVFVLGKAMIADDGYNIGSPWAAVGAALGAAVDEQDIIDEVPEEEKVVILQCVFKGGGKMAICIYTSGGISGLKLTGFFGECKTSCFMAGNCDKVVRSRTKRSAL